MLDTRLAELVRSSYSMAPSYLETVPHTAVDPYTGEEVTVEFKIDKRLKDGDNAHMGDKNMGFTPEQEAEMDAPQQ